MISRTYTHKVHPTHAFLCSTIGVVVFILVSEWFGGLSTGEIYMHEFFVSRE